MKPICCDTSFLFAFYGRDQHTDRAKAMASRLTAPLAITFLNGFEFLNAIYLAMFRRLLSIDDATMMQAAFEADLASGDLARASCDLEGVLIEARRLSAAHTPADGYRAFDILHVAAALVLDAGDFLSFDKKQCALALAEGVAVNALEKPADETSSLPAPPLT